MPENHDDRREFYDKELWPQLNPGKFLIHRAEEARKEGKLEDALLYLQSALLINPNNQQAHEKVREVETLSIKRLAHDFVKRFYPSEMKLFDLAWRIFKDIRPEDLTQTAVSGALGIAGHEASDLKTPKVIVLFNQVSSENIQALPDDKAKKKVTDIGRAIGCPKALLDQVTQFLLRS